MKNQTEMETRTSKIQIRSLSDGQESRIVEGYAVRFNEPSADMGFIETILPGAITEETIRKSDIFARLDHREDTVLARSRFGNGSLILELRNDGLFYTFEAPHTQIGDELSLYLPKEISGPRKMVNSIELSVKLIDYMMSHVSGLQRIQPLLVLLVPKRFLMVPKS